MFYYMRDNHSVKMLSANIPEALVQIEAEFNDGYTHGALCWRRIGQNFSVNASGEKNRLPFLNECKDALELFSGSFNVVRFVERFGVNIQKCPESSTNNWYNDKYFYIEPTGKQLIGWFDSEVKAAEVWLHHQINNDKLYAEVLEMIKDGRFSD